LVAFQKLNVEDGHVEEKLSGLTGKKHDKARHWRSHEIEALCTYQTPFFTGVVDKENARLDLYQTMTRFFLSGHRLTYWARLCINTPTGEDIWEAVRKRGRGSQGS
jgi:hypothetical protein